MFMLWRKRREKNKIIILIDFENLIISVRQNIEPAAFSVEAGFKKIIENIANEVGEIIGIFAFLPPDRAIVWGRDLYRLGFNIILCPRMKDKEGMEQDTTDARLTEFGEWLINHLDNLTHVCVGSGDRDFSPLMRKAALKGLRRIVFAASSESLSSELIRLTDKNPQTGEKMIYLFLPIEE